MTALRHVVIADPERAGREKLAALAEQAGRELDGELRVHVAKTGTEALLLIDRFKPALVLTEVVLAELNGLALLRRVRENATSEGTRPPPFILVTTLVRETDRYWGLRNGAHAYVTRPFDDELLRARIRDVLVAGAAARPEKLGL
ncbi:MAG: response regulator [Myxococcales bacterium]|nr:response regulator [Myxococcales bacterium]MCB9754820.1 response regulator [Myxococcales bacterium]